MAGEESDNFVIEVSKWLNKTNCSFGTSTNGIDENF
jgi:hypothetical protein